MRERKKVKVSYSYQGIDECNSTPDGTQYIAGLSLLCAVIIIIKFYVISVLGEADMLPEVAIYNTRLSCISP